MNICDIAFSTDWFLTIPGMLITGGVILLVIALIMLLVSASKGKKNKKMKNNATAVSPEMGVGVAPVENATVTGAMPTDIGAIPAVGEQVSPVQADVTPGVPTLDIKEPAQSIDSVPVNPEVAPMQMPGVDMPASVNPVSPIETAPSVSSFSASPVPGLDSNPNGFATADAIPTISNESVVPPVVEPMASPIPAVEVTPTINPIPSVEVPTIEPAATVDPVVASAVEVVPTETIPAPVVPPVVENASNPMGNIAPTPEEPRPIYGGANPLEATQNLPKIDVHHEPYSGGREVVQEPASVPAPEVAPAAPNVDVMPNIPIVENIPATEVAMPPQGNPVGIGSVPNVATSIPTAAPVSPVANATPTVGTTSPATMPTPAYSAVQQPTSPVADVEQL